MQAQPTARGVVVPLRRRPTATDVALRENRMSDDREALLAIGSYMRERALALAQDSPYRNDLLAWGDRLVVRGFEVAS